VDVEGEKKMLMTLFTFVVQFGMLCIVWWFTTEHNKRDFIFWVWGLILAFQTCQFFGSIFIVQSRHFFAFFMLIAIYYRRHYLKNNFGGLAWIYLLLVFVIYIASAWSQYPADFFVIKLRRTIYAFLMVLMVDYWLIVRVINKGFRN
jgi:hypothetical protein